MKTPAADPTSPSTTTHAPHAARSLRDPVACVRAARWTRPDEVPPTPEGYVTPDPNARSFSITYVREGNRPELAAAVSEVARQADDFTQHFGLDAPELGDTDHLRASATDAHQRIVGLTETVARMERALDAARLQLAVAISDGHDIVKVVDRELSHRVDRRPQLRDAWPAVLRYAGLHAEDIARGIERARRARAAAKRTPPANDADD